MTTYVVSYDLIGPNRDYDAIIEHLETYESHARVLESVWLIVTDKSASQVRTAAEAHLDQNDRIVVIGAQRGNWATRVTTGHKDFLHKFL